MKKRLFLYILSIVFAGLMGFFAASVYISHTNSFNMAKDAVTEIARIAAGLYDEEKDISAFVQAGGNARITVISPDGSVLADSHPLDLETAEKLNYASLPTKRSATLGGIVPGYSIAVDYKVIAGIRIADLRLSKVTVAIPNPKDPNAEIFERSILGQNVLEYFNYHMDTGNDKIYFEKNPNPKPISEDTKCGIVFLADEVLTE